ncbi:MAG TPA: glycine--tRNA ligase subunit beta [Terriglobales bacterium]
MSDFLLEIGTEEIPARMIDGACEDLSKRVTALLLRERLAESPSIQAYSTPRRLAVFAQGVSSSQADVTEHLTGPSLKIAYKDGVPTPAAQAFARKSGVDVSALQKVTTPKGEYLAASVQKKGRSASEILSESLPKEIAGIYWAKSMYWRGKSAERFVRPVRWMVSLLDEEVVPIEFASISAGHTSQGHRILSNGPVTINRPADYALVLSKNFVIVSASDREHRIRKALDAATRTIPGARWREDKSLLDTVVDLTECPSVVLGSFDPEFLSLPPEVLVTVMRDHQKYFALEDAEGKLLPHFLAVLNTDGDPDGLIRHGNERVLRARFNDARFFWNTDQKISLRDRVEMLKSVTFQKDLGSYFDKTMRVQKLASLVSTILEVAGVHIRPGVVHKAALLAKADLTTDLVKEFTELQGVVGGLYAKVQQLDPVLPAATAAAIGDAIYHQYQPESMDDDVPPTVEGAVLAIADKVDTIVGMYALGAVPSGSKDPFGLRRAGNGIVKILAEKKLPVGITQLVADSIWEYMGSEAEKKFVKSSSWWRTRERITALRQGVWLNALRTAEVDTELPSPTVLLWERLSFYLREYKGFAYDTVNAVLSTEDLTPDLLKAQNPDYTSEGIGIVSSVGADSNRRLDPANLPPLALDLASAISAKRGTPELESALVSFKRTRNILKQALDKGFAIGPFTPMLHSEAEADVVTLMNEAGSGFWELLQRAEYGTAIDRMARLAEPFERYFEIVMVMHEHEPTRRNRLGFLSMFYQQFRKIADFSEIVTENKSS